MPNADDQLEFLSLAFPKDRKTLRAEEVAARLDCTVQHVLDLIEAGDLTAINIAGGDNKTDRRYVRIPVEAWQKFLKQRTL